MSSNRSIKNMSIPLVIEQILVVMVGIADTVMISYAGEAAIFGATLVNMIGRLVTAVPVAVDTGGAVTVSQHFGKKVKENANEFASQLVTVSFLFSLAFMIFCALFHALILRLLFGEVIPDVMTAANMYLVIMALSYPFLGLYNSSAALYRSMERTKVTMYVPLLMNVPNIAGNAIGIFVLYVGVPGVAVPTLISRSAATVIMVGLVFQSSNEIFICWRRLLAQNRELIGKILGIAVPNGIENRLFALGKVSVTSIVAIFGTTQIAANGVTSSVDQIAVLVMSAVDLAIVPLVGRYIGAGEQDQVKVYIKKLMKISYLYAAILGGVVITWLPVILQLFDVSEGTYKVIVWLVVLHNILAIALHPTSFNLANSLRASGDVKITMYIGIGPMVVFRLGTTVLLGILCDFGVFGVWAVMGMDWLVQSTAFTIRYKNGKWRRMKIIQVSVR